MKFRAPGKIILCGEHAVVQGTPALVIPMNRYATCDIAFSHANTFKLQLPDFAIEKNLEKHELTLIKEQVEQRYQEFQEGAITIEKVLHEPWQLAVYTLAVFIQHYSKAKVSHLTITSEIPVGRGGGSSAAVIIAILRGLFHSHGVDVDDDLLFSLAKPVEDKQHGKSSGMDLWVAIKDTCLHYENGQYETFTMPDWDFSLIDTGKPLSSTGETVVHSQEKLSEPNRIEPFNRCVKIMYEALQDDDYENFCLAINLNQALLHNLGVVSKKTQQFIMALSQKNIAAKIIGAGTLKGENSGLLFAMTKTPQTKLLEEYGYTRLLRSGHVIH